MTIPQMIVTYAVCWWLVLFMVLPHGLSVAEKPEPGHAPSAPANPRLKRKFGITTVIAMLPAILIYLIAAHARAEESIYHASSGCEPLETYHAPDDVNARDGYGANGKKVVAATLNQSTILGDMDHVDIPLEIPSGKYLNADKHNVDLSQSNINLGKLQVNKDGESLLNGQPIAQQKVYTKECGK